jgi:hypothetical protein
MNVCGLRVQSIALELLHSYYIEITLANDLDPPSCLPRPWLSRNSFFLLVPNTKPHNSNPRFHFQLSPRYISLIFSYPDSTRLATFYPLRESHGEPYSALSACPSAVPILSPLAPAKRWRLSLLMMTPPPPLPLLRSCASYT